jgi:hypothetical protein
MSGRSRLAFTMPADVAGVILPVYEWCDEFDTLDLREARSLLDLCADR